MPQRRPESRVAEHNPIGELRIGTCSWADQSLIQCGRFYPAQVRTPAERLRYYASFFPTVEVDSAFYALPTARNSALWVERTPGEFLFHVKAYALLTQHAADTRSLPRELQEGLPGALRGQGRIYLRHLPAELQEEVWHRFEEALLPLDSAGKLGLVLFQFPPWFIPGRERQEYILHCQERLPQYRLAVEFRNNAWLREGNAPRTLGFLKEHRLTFVCVDEPQGFPSSVPPLAVTTTDTAYVRFHGRNRETWERRGATASERFNYYYSEEELQEWVPRLRALQEEARETHVLFNTNREDQGIVNARKLASLLGQGMLQLGTDTSAQGPIA